MQNFNTAELRPVERARAYLLKKMLKKALREDDGADVLRDSPCSALTVTLCDALCRSESVTKRGGLAV